MLRLGGQYVSAFLTFLLIGLGTEMLLMRAGIPYTALLLVWGVGLGIANETYQANWSLLGPGLRLWEDVSPDLFLAVFLPVLLFSAAISLEWHYVKKFLTRGMLLAGPGALLGIGVAAVLVKYTFPYEWTWSQCLLISSILSATDPVAVAVVLKEAGVPRKMQSIVNLEALLNDGAAFVVFLIVQGWAEGFQQSAPQIIRQVFRLSVGGPAIGLAIGIGTTSCMKQLQGHFTLEVLLTVSSAYAAFVVSDDLCGSSGVLSVVALGLWMCYCDMQQVSRSAIKDLRLIWELLEHVANTLVFILVGVTIAREVWSYEQDSMNVGVDDWGYSILLWFYLLVVRLFMLVVLLPGINASEKALDWSELTVLGWSGLRGAVGLALGHSVYNDKRLPAKFRSKQFFHIGSIVLLTILVQGSSIKLLLRILGFAKAPLENLQWMGEMKKQVEALGNRQIEAAKQDIAIGGADYPAVQKLTQLTMNLAVPKSASKRLFRVPWLPFPHRARNVPFDEVGAHTAMMEAVRPWKVCAAHRRKLFLQAARTACERLSQNHFIQPFHLAMLKASVLDCTEKSDESLLPWQYLKEKITRSWTSQITRKLLTFLTPVRKLAFCKYLQLLRDQIILALALCRAHKAANQSLRAMHNNAAYGATFSLFDELSNWHLLEDNANLGGEVQQSDTQVKQAKEFLLDMRDGWPELMQTIANSQLSTMILVSEDTSITRLQNLGLLESQEGSELQDIAQKKVKAVQSTLNVGNLLELKALLRQNDAFQTLPDADFQKVWSKTQTQAVEDGGKLEENEQLSSSVAVLLQGKIALTSRLPAQVDSEETPADYENYILGQGKSRSGAIIAWSMFSRSSQQQFEHIAVTPCVIAWIPHLCVQVLARRYQCVELGIWRSLAASLTVWQSFANNVSYETLVNYFRSCSQAAKVPAGCKVDFHMPFILLSGTMLHHRSTFNGSKQEIVTAGNSGVCMWSTADSGSFQSLSPLRVLLLDQILPNGNLQARQHNIALH